MAMIEVVLVGLVGAIATGALFAIVRRGLLPLSAAVVLVVGVPLTLGIWIHPVAGAAAGLVVIEGLYEGREAGLYDDREEDLRTLYYRLRADLRRGWAALVERLEERRGETDTDR